MMRHDIPKGMEAVFAVLQINEMSCFASSAHDAYHVKVQ
jgi:hypothetical protein